MLLRNLKGRPPASDLFGRKGRTWLAAQELRVQDELRPGEALCHRLGGGNPGCDGDDVAVALLGRRRVARIEDRVAELEQTVGEGGQLLVSTPVSK